MSPLERFLKEAIDQFEQYLIQEKGLAESAKEHRLRGARTFSEFLLGRKYPKYGRIKRASDQ